MNRPTGPIVPATNAIAQEEARWQQETRGPAIEGRPERREPGPDRSAWPVLPSRLHVKVGCLGNHTALRNK